MKDQQSLVQAVWVALEQKVDLKEVLRWSKAEGEEAKFEIFRERLKAERQPDKRGKRR